MTDPEVDTSRTAVRTYVPAYQRDEWDAHAEELDMSRSEFVRSMVQAGRQFFDGSENGDVTSDGAASNAGDESDPEEARSPGATPGEEMLETAVLDALSRHEYLSWEELVDVLTDDVERRLEETLQELQAADEVRYSGPNGGYTVDE